MAEAKRWAIYALGGGLGHLTRGVALARAALKQAAADSRSLQISLLTNSPLAGIVCQAVRETGLIIRRLEPAQNGATTQAQTIAAVHRWLADWRPDTLLVDTFPRGLGGELADVINSAALRTVLVQRDLTERYARRPDVLAAVARYDLIVIPGERADWMPPRAVLTPPWLVRDRNELLAPQAAAEILQVTGSDRPVVAFVGCGTPAEIEEVRSWAVSATDRLHGRADVRFLDAGQSATTPCSPAPAERLIVVRHWPLLELLPGVDVMVSGGGYNSVHEARFTGTRFLAVARPRLYDCQDRRLQSWGITCVTPATLSAAVQHSLARQTDDELADGRATGCSLDRTHPAKTDGRHAENGVHQAVRLILADERPA